MKIKSILSFSLFMLVAFIFVGCGGPKDNGKVAIDLTGRIGFSQETKAIASMTLEKEKLAVGESTSLTISVTDKQYAIRHVVIDQFIDLSLSTTQQGVINSITRTDASHRPVVIVHFQKIVYGDIEDITLSNYGTGTEYNVSSMGLTITPQSLASTGNNGVFNDFIYWNWDISNPASAHGGSTSSELKNIKVTSTEKNFKLNPALTMGFLPYSGTHIDAVNFEVTMVVIIDGVEYMDTQLFKTWALSELIPIRRCYFTLKQRGNESISLDSKFELGINFSDILKF